MVARIDELMKLPELRDLEIVGGSKGIFRIVRWFHFIETPEDVSYIHEDELILFTGIAILSHKNRFIELIKGLLEKKASGIIVNIGKYFKHVPDYIKKLADENDFPIFEIPWETNLSQVTMSICNYLVKKHMNEFPNQDWLMNMILFDTITYEDFMKRVSALEYTSLNSFRIIIAEIVKFDQYLSSKNISDEQNIIAIKDTFLIAVNSSIWAVKCRPISFLNNKSVVFLLINEKNKFTNLENFTHDIRKNVKKTFPNISINIGIGNLYTQFSEIKRSYIEAEKALKAIKAKCLYDESISYLSIGANKILTEIEDISFLKEYYNSTVGILDQYDLQNNTDFSKIFYVFLEEGGNCIQASKKLYLHRNTLMYKINKIQEIIKKDLSNTDVRCEFYLGYMVKHMNNF